MCGYDRITETCFAYTLDYAAGHCAGEKTQLVQKCDIDGVLAYYFMFDTGRVIVIPESETLAIAAYQSY